MDQSDIIIIDDTPPTSPVKTNFKNQNNITISIDPKNYFFFPKNTIKFNYNFNQFKKINQNNNNSYINKMNLLLPSDKNNEKNNSNIVNMTVQNEKRDIIVDPNLRRDLQARGVVIQSRKNTEISEKAMSNERDNQKEVANLFGFQTDFESPVYLPSYESYTMAQTKKNPGYSDNFANVKRVESYQFLPQSFKNSAVQERYSMQYMPEYIDINNFMSYGAFGGSHFMSTENLLTANNIYQTTNVVLNSVNKTTNNLKRKLNQTTIETNSLEVIDLSEDSNEKMEKTNKTNEIESNDDDLEIVYVGAYAREPKYQTLPHTVYKLPTFEEDKENSFAECNRQSPISLCESISNDSQNSQEGLLNKENDKNSNKRKRKPTLTVPRRNPKRQVQIEKDYLKLLDNVIIESKKDAKPKKPGSGSKKANRSSDKKPSNPKKTRQPLNVGAVYRPPSPISLHHLREWPESGMHERPEFNPATNKLEPFDNIIRNISVNYPSTKNPSKTQEQNDTDKSTAKSELQWLCHEMLHHVLAYSATVKTFLKTKDEKANFMEDLSLTDTLTTPLNLTKNNKIVLYNNETKEDKEKIEDSMKELMGNSLLLYSITNEVSKDNLAKYIQSIKPEDVIDWSNKQLSLVD